MKGMSETRFDDVLFGADPTEKIVALETGDRDTTLFIREGDATVTRAVPFVPWLVMDKERHFAGGRDDRVGGGRVSVSCQVPQRMAFIPGRPADAAR